jgi:aromatic ring-cleaving dioxygenase
MHGAHCKAGLVIDCDMMWRRYVVDDKAIEGPVGPHPVSQFEFVFFRPAYTEFINWLQARPQAAPPNI